MSETGLGDRPPGAPDFEMPMKKPDKDKGDQGGDSLGVREGNIPYEPRDSGGQGGGSTPSGNGIVQNIKAGFASFAGVIKSKKGATGTIIAILGISGVGMAGISPITIVMNKENAIETSDMTHRSMTPRVPRVMANMLSGDSNAVEGSLEDKMRNPTKKFLRSLNNAEIKPMNGSTPMDSGSLSGRGKPDVMPTHYEINGQSIGSDGVMNHIQNPDNIKLKRKVLGRGGVMGMFQRSWGDSGHIVKKLFNPFKLSRKGGNADNSDSTPEEKRNKFNKKLPNESEAGATRSKITGKFQEHVGKFKKGGTIGTLAAGACLAVKAPRIITSAVAAVQLMQLLPFSTDLFLSPSDKTKSSLVTDVPPSDVEGFAKPLTDVYIDEETGIKGSAFDSKYLLQSLGLVTTTLAVSKFAPGYSMMRNPIVQAAGVIEDSSAYELCDVLLSPASMYGLWAVQATLQAMSGPLGIAKIAVDIAIEVLTPMVIEAVTNAVLSNPEILINALGNKELIDAKGIPLGDGIGTSIEALVSLAGKSRYIPTGSEKGIPAASQIVSNQIEEERQMDIAALSPFDTSSRWTFLGSIVYNLSASMIVSGQYKNPAFSIIPTIINQASTLLTFNKANASSEDLFNAKYRHADECGMSDSVNGNPAVSYACTEFTPPIEELTTMGQVEAIDIIRDEGWIDPSIIPDNFLPDTMLSSGYIVKDTWMSDYMTECSDIQSANHLISTSGCRIDISPSSAENGEDENLVAESTLQTIKSPQAKAAAIVFLQDIQVMNILNGDDDPAYMSEGSGNEMIDPLPSISGDGDWLTPVSGSISSPYGYRSSPISGAGELHDGIDYAAACGTPVYASNTGSAEATTATGFGNVVLISHGSVSGLNSPKSLYAHLERASFSGTREVQKGDLIGYVGSTGWSTGCHLHFSIYNNGTAYANSVDPALYLSGGG